MVARIWHGWTRPEDADAYEALLKPELLPGITKAPGFLRSYLMRRDFGTEVEFMTIMVFESLDAIKAIAGPNYEDSIIPEERKKYILRHDEKAAHFEIASVADAV